MAGPSGVGERRTTDWQRYFEQPDPGEAARRKPLVGETAPWAKDYENLRSPNTSIGLLTVDPTGGIAFKPAAPAASDSAAQREAAAKYARVVAVVHPERRFSDLKSLTGEIFRLKSELAKALTAMNPGTTIGSMMATYLGRGDVQRMRALGEAGNAIEGVAGGVGVVVERERAERDRERVVRAGVPPNRRASTTQPSSSQPSSAERAPGNTTRSTKPSSPPVTSSRPVATSAPAKATGHASSAGIAGSSPSFSATERTIVDEVRAIPQARLRALFEVGGGELTINGRTIIVEPGMPASGMTLFEENAFVVGREAFTSDAELTKTLLHETQRLVTSRSSGGVSGELATSETEAAASFAERAYGRYFK
jgi:hypothetical protein